MVAPPIKRHGGKAYLAKRIVELLPADCTHYHEPYFGSGAVLMAKPPTGSEVVNDLDGDLMAFWSVLQHRGAFEALQRRLAMTPLSRYEFDSALSRHASTIVETAARFFVRNRQSRQALGKDYVTPTRRLRRGMNEQVSAWLSAIDGLEDAYHRFRTVEVDCISALESIRRRDHGKCVHYLDPPYLHETRTATAAYQHEMTRDDHVELLKALEGIEGKFVLSGYHSDLYDVYAVANGWRVVEFDLPNHASGAATKERKTETLWMNY